ncbi:PRC-barrel domain-containing protein [Roseicella sp. DB1501]|uniref:PRC-barrel domain-containing protein n=1 Tax=Roseicella sp. DB1501 TaxID=2730925 RepID=UPI0014918A81|nr:PRC-barrel domain-containing protein [Roseicella sp. DB1501]NOG72639.1 PRC-barrel domain-containing protein [Roseicella sp. DB1501]
MMTIRQRLAVLAILVGPLASPLALAPALAQGTGSAADSTAPADTTTPTPTAPALPSGPAAAPNLARGSGASGSGGFAVDTAAIRGGRRASKVIGSAVYNENNESVGEVDDLIIPAGGGSPVAVISVGGFLGIGAKLVTVPYDRLQAPTGSGRWVLTGATKDSLGSLPTFTYDSIAEKKG